MAFGIMRIAKLKTPGVIQAVGQHNTRDRATRNADPEMPNRVLVGPPLGGAERERTQQSTVQPVTGEPAASAGAAPGGRPAAVPGDAWALVQARIAEVDARIRKNGVLACEVFMSASPEFFRPHGGAGGTWDEDRLEAWVPVAMGWLESEWGKKNVVSAVLHLDETTPHIQAVVVPIDPDSGRMNAARWTSGRKAMSEMQDRYGVAVAEVGLQRGVKGSQAEHTDIRDWYGHLQRPLAAVPAPTVQAPGLLVRESSRAAFARDESHRLQATQQPAVENLETQARSYRVADGQRRAAEATNLRLSAQIAAKDAELATLQAEKAQLQGQLNTYRLIPLTEAAGWFDPEELVEAGVRIGKDNKGRERIFDPKGAVIGRNAIDLVKTVHGCDSAGEAAAWIEVRAKAQQQNGAEIAARAMIDYAVSNAAEQAMPMRRDVQNPEHGFRDARCARASRQVVKQRPTWTVAQRAFKRVGLSLQRERNAKGWSYTLLDALFTQRPVKAFPPTAAPGQPDFFAEWLGQIEQQEEAAQFRRQMEDERDRENRSRGPSR